MAELPSGTVTFLFTDIEGSTRLLKQLGDRYADALGEHQRILRECFAAHRGREIDTQGDSFFVAFSRAGDAVASAIDAQISLESHAWPDGAQVRVRMGLHSGEPQATGERYVGFGVHRAARVGAVGHGGQILVSSATRALVEDDLSPEVSLRDLGLYRLKDVERPEQLFQVDARGRQRDFPPLAAPRVGGPRRGRRLLVAAAALAVATAAAVVAYGNATRGPSIGSADKPITIATTWTDEDPEYTSLMTVLKTFEDLTGFRTKLRELIVSDSSEIPGSLKDDPAMVALVPSPGVLADLARDGDAKALTSLGITDEHLRRSYGKTWLDLAAVDGEIYGFPAKTQSKSLLWYRPDEFERMGLDVPRTWGELMSTTTRIKRAGETPWTLAAGDGWTLTDWFENVYIRTAGPWKYDGLFAGKLGFDDPSVIAAVRRMSAILREDHLAGGRAGALSTDFSEAVTAVFGKAPRAQLYVEGGFVGTMALAYLEPKPKPGRTIAAAPFPRINPDAGNPVVVGADFVVALEDDEAIRELLLYLSSPGAGRIWVSIGSVVSPHKGIVYSAYPHALVRAEAQQLTKAEVVRFDGSDLLPGTLGHELGLALQEVVARPERAATVMTAFQRKVARVFKLD